jgi:dTDP-4-dehydrorhamnose 3,5-epimerase
MEITTFQISGPVLIRTKTFHDERGFFTETFNRNLFESLQLPIAFVQDNQSVSKRNVVRGLHYQKPPFAQGKLVRVVKGRALDVLVDIRQGSPTYGQHLAVELSDKETLQLWIPEGFAHGFASLEDETCFQYKCTNYYSPLHETGIRWNDPTLAIEWNLIAPIVSDKDMALPEFSSNLSDFTYSPE